MSYAVGKEVSSIKPETPKNTRKVRRFSYDTSEYDSYAKMGFQPPDKNSIERTNGNKDFSTK